MLNPTPWVNRPHPGPRARALPLTAAERRRVLEVIRPARAERRLVQRGQALLLLGAGVGNQQTAELIGVHLRTVERWRKRFKERGSLDALYDAPRPGRPPSLSRSPTLRK